MTLSSQAWTFVSQRLPSYQGNDSPAEHGACHLQLTGEALSRAHPPAAQAASWTLFHLRRSQMEAHQLFTLESLDGRWQPVLFLKQERAPAARTWPLTLGPKRDALPKNNCPCCASIRRRRQAQHPALLQVRRSLRAAAAWTIHGQRNFRRLPERCALVNDH